MPRPSPTIAYLTAGAGGMFCGSCLHDNTLARALRQLDLDVALIPTYTPIRTDEEDSSQARVFFGGLNIFLSQVVPGYRWLPRFLTAWLDHPALIRWATKRASSTSAAALGALTVSMLRGVHGNQRRETETLCEWLEQTLQPRLVVFSNALIAGCVPRLKQRWPAPVLVTLQGDDIFLDSLPEPYQSQAVRAIQELVPHIDGFLVNSHYYGDLMGQRLGIPKEKIQVVPLGLDVSGFPSPGQPRSRPADRPPTIGYLARIAPEKGFHLLIDAFLELRRRGTIPSVRLRAAGWRGAHQVAYFDEQVAKLREAGVESSFEYCGTVDRAGKIAFLQSLDLFSVPTTYREPKGLFLLEALAAGVPVIAPEHGAFPELLGATGGGRLVPPNDPVSLADELERLLSQPEHARQLGAAGQETVHRQFAAAAMAQQTWNVWRRVLEPQASR